MRILFVTPYIPTPKRGRTYNFIRSLAELGHEITLAALSVDSLSAEASAKKKMQEFCEAVHIVPFSVTQGLLAAGLHAATPTPLRVAYYGAAPMERTLRKIIQRQQFDVAHFVHLNSAQFARALQGKVPAFLDAIHCTALQQAELLSKTAWYAFGRAVTVGDYVKLKRYEPKLAAQFQRILMASDVDAAYLKRLGKSQNLSLPIEVAPNGLDLEHYAPQSARVILPGNIVFSSRANDKQSQDAALYFCEEIFPAIRQSYPFATFTMVGGSFLPQLDSLAAQPGAGIEITGPVRDIRPYLARAALAVCPMRSGEGVQNKLIEALAMGKAVVATPLAVRAIDSAAPGESLCVADTPLSFATQIMYLLNHPEEVERLGQNARTFAEEHFDWQAIARRVTGFYEHAVEQSHAVSANASASR